MNEYYLIDTNVLLAAEGMATHLKPHQKAVVSKWLADFQRNSDAYLLIDSEGAPGIPGKTRIVEEYLKKMSKSAVSWQIIKSKMDGRRCLPYKIAFEGTPPHEFAVLPPTLTRNRWIDPADKKFIAVALEHIKGYPRQRCKIVNATDTDWSQCASILEQHYIEMVQLLP